MKIVMLDYDLSFTPDIMRRLTDCGVTDLWTFAQSHEHQLGPAEFDFRTPIAYTAKAKSAGFQNIRLQAPIYLPQWVPDEWLLRNDLGVYSIHREHPIDLNLTCQDMTSYWNPEAEAHCHDYIAAFRKAVEPDAIVVPSMGGSCGEYMFPAGAIASLGMEQHRPWWHDDYAEASYRDSGLSRDAWWRRERKVIIERRLSWYSERWTCFVVNEHPRKAWSRGLVDIDNTLLELDPLPNIIVWCGMRDDLFDSAMKRAEHFPVCWTGAEGADGVVPNSRKIREQNLPVQSLLCGPAFPAYGGKIDEGTFRKIAEAVRI